jgi:glycosyltransferase involved in cell wall biosynthesis
VVIFPGLFLKYKSKTKLVIEWLDWFGRGGTATERKSYIKFFMVPIETFFEERFRKFADGTIGLGEPLTQRAIKLGINKNIETILHGCDTDNIKVYSKSYSREFLNLAPDPIYLGYTGRMRGDVASLFVAIIEKLRFKYNLNVYGILIGNTTYNIDQHINKNLDKFIIKTGWIEYKQINQYMCACDILLVPFKKSLARNSIWPSKLNDYLSAGRPIISSNLSVITEIFNSYDIGYLVDDDSESFASACIKLIEAPQIMNQLGNNARKLAEGKLSWEKISNNIESFYKKIIFNQEILLVP